MYVHICTYLCICSGWFVWWFTDPAVASIFPDESSILVHKPFSYHLRSSASSARKEVVGNCSKKKKRKKRRRRREKSGVENVLQLFHATFVSSFLPPFLQKRCCSSDRTAMFICTPCLRIYINGAYLYISLCVYVFICANVRPSPNWLSALNSMQSGVVQTHWCPAATSFFPSTWLNRFWKRCYVTYIYSIWSRT